MLGCLGVEFDVRRRAFATTRSIIGYRKGWWTRRWTLVRHAKIQTVTLVTSPFDRRWKMATVRVDTAGGSSVEGFSLPYLSPAVAEELREDLVRRSAHLEFRW